MPFPDRALVLPEYYKCSCEEVVSDVNDSKAAHYNDYAP
jgi:hypothetical protein